MTLDRVRSWLSPKRVLIDFMIIDRILEVAGLVERIQFAVANGSLMIVETHILRDQLSKIRNPAQRTLLLGVYDALPKVTVPTSGIVLDVSRLGGAEFVDERNDLERIVDIKGTKGDQGRGGRSHRRHANGACKVSEASGGGSI